MFAALAVGGPRPPLPQVWDFSFPLYIGLSLLLIVVLVRVRLTAWTALAAFVAGAAWEWASHAFGILPAAALAALFAVVIGAALRRIAWPRRR